VSEGWAVGCAEGGPEGCRDWGEVGVVGVPLRYCGYDGVGAEDEGAESGKRGEEGEGCAQVCEVG
jgi:hypothetical protein